MMQPALPDPVLLACTTVLLAATTTDLTNQTIPNGLTVPACMAGLFFHGCQANAIPGLFFSATGLLTGALLLLWPYLRRWTGGGDVKLLAAMGSWLGPARVVELFLLSTIAGGVMAAVHMGYRYGNQSGGQFPRRLLSPQVGGLATRGIPYAPAIASGYAIHLLWP